jgi:hypothetical protein
LTKKSVLECGELISECEILTGDMLQKKKEGLVKQLRNYNIKSMDNKLLKLKTTCTCRYEQIE